MTDAPNMKISDILIQAKALIETPDKWVQGQYYGFRDESGSLFDSTKEKANCFCSLGALDKIFDVIYDDSKYWSATNYLYQTKIHKSTTDESIIGFNDSHTHEEVMTMFDQAIELAEKDGD